MKVGRDGLEMEQEEVRETRIHCLYAYHCLRIKTNIFKEVGVVEMNRI